VEKKRRLQITTRRKVDYTTVINFSLNMIIMEIWSAVEFIKDNLYLLTHPINLLFSGVVYLCKLYLLSTWGNDTAYICARLSNLPIEFWLENTGDVCNHFLDSFIYYFSVWILVTATLIIALSRPKEIATTLVWMANPIFYGNVCVASTVQAHAVPLITATTTASTKKSSYNPQSAITRKVNETTKKRNEATFLLFASFVSVLKTAKLGKAGTQLLSDFEARYLDEIAICQKRLDEIKAKDNNLDYNSSS